MDADVLAAILGGSLLGGLVGAFAALFTASRQLSVETRQWQLDALDRGMRFLTGGRQERSVGIGLIESLIRSGSVPSNTRPAVDTVLWNQLRFVVYEGEVWRKHENLNARRLMALVEESPALTGIPEYSADEIREIRRRVDEAATQVAREGKAE
jgi:hypothetical protein